MFYVELLSAVLGTEIVWTNPKPAYYIKYIFSILTLCRVFYRLSFGPMSFDPAGRLTLSFDPGSYDPKSLDPGSVNLKALFDQECIRYTSS